MKSPAGDFTENMLRPILPLTAAQQLDLVTRLASKALVKSQFKTLAEKYRARNEAGAWIIAELVGVDKALVDEALAEIAKGVYDDEWVANGYLKNSAAANTMASSTITRTAFINSSFEVRSLGTSILMSYVPLSSFFFAMGSKSDTLMVAPCGENTLISTYINVP